MINLFYTLNTIGMNSSKMSLEEILFQSDLRINNSLSDAKILNAVTPLGYNEAKLNDGAALCTEASTLYFNQKKEYGEVDGAQKQFETDQKMANNTYKDHVQIARIAFRGNVQAGTTLELNGRRATTISGWIKQTLNFYHALMGNEEWKVAMAEYGQDEAKFQAQLGLIDKVREGAEQVKKEKGDAQNATQVRDEKIEELVDWINDYEVIARIALADKPQLLEKLGIVVKS